MARRKIKFDVKDVIFPPAILKANLAF